MDQYKITFGISAAEFALKKSDEFKRSFFSNTQSGSNTLSNPDQGGNMNQRNLSTSGDDVLSQEGKKITTPTSLGGTKIVDGEDEYLSMRDNECLAQIVPDKLT